MTTRPAPVATSGIHTAGQHLAAIAASLSDHGITSRLTHIGDTPVLAIDAPGAEEDFPTIAIDPDTHVGPELRFDCTCTWTPAPGATPQAIVATITAVLNALRPASERT